MIIAILVVLGLCLGSFVNALVWRTHEKVSITHGRSMCPHCRHGLTVKDLVPVLSWLVLRGKCRYCREPISIQYPLVELTTALLFVVSYIWWPNTFDSPEIAVFSLWLAVLTGLMALLVYDLRWFLLPNRLIYPLATISGLFALLRVINNPHPLQALLNTGLAVLVGGGIFYALFQVSGGKWIGGGDVKLGWLLGLLVGTPATAMLMIFLAALLGTFTSIPLLMAGRLKRHSLIPFGPFLVIAAIIVSLFGTDILDWYKHVLLGI